MLNWINRILRRAIPAAPRVQAHLTFGVTSVGRTTSRSNLLSKRQLWVWPILAVVLLSVIGYGVRMAIQRTIKASVKSEVDALLNVERSMVEKWLKVQESSALALAKDPQIRKLIIDLLAANDQALAPDRAATSDREQDRAALLAQLAKELEPGLSSQDFVGYVVTDKSQRIVAAFTRELIGTTVPQHESFLKRTIKNGPTVSLPFPSEVMLKDQSGRLRTGTPTMFVAAPVVDEDLNVVAVLALRIEPEKEFTSILQLGRIGESGETYAIDKSGRMVSNSRFDESLIRLGLLPDTEDARSILNVTVRDPGGNMKEGFRPIPRRSELPLTKIATAAIGGNSGIMMDPYNDYRGCPSIGAFAWLPKYEMGLITEIQTAEAYRPLTILQWTFFSIFALLIASSVAIFGFTLMLARAQREAQKAVVEAKHLGQYRLEERLGAGAMGVVYKGHHAMLRRPTAIKLLNIDKVNESSIQRFEREVQITCKLTNPNTVAIYDYGRTPEGVFYYAMEYLDGIDLQALIEHYGPQPEGRVIRILKGICGSLYEAHSLGLVHRDIKPANIMLNRRGGDLDVVKVLDFGLVRALDDAKRAEPSGGLTGTPLYMSPEAIQTPDLVDARSDLYAVGAVGYFLLTGQPVFEAKSLVELCQQQIDNVPEPPSQRLKKSVSSELESVLLTCLQKNRSKRPQTARDLAALLDRPLTANSWSLEDAEAWWGRHERSQASSGLRAGAGAVSANAVSNLGTSAAGHSPRTTAASTSSSGFDRTLASGGEAD